MAEKEEKAPEDRRDCWFAFVVDGRVAGVMCGGPAFRREEKRVRGLVGIDIRPAKESEIVRFVKDEN